VQLLPDRKEAALVTVIKNVKEFNLLMKYMNDWEIYFLLYNDMDKVEKIVNFF